MATRVLLKEPLLRQCVLTLLTSACQQWNHGQEILAPITVTAHRREGLLRVDVHDPQLFIDAIAAEDLFSSHMLSNDSLDFSNSSNFGQGLTAVKQSLQSVGGNCGWEWHEVSGVVLSIELPCLFYTDEHPAEAPTAEVPTEQAAHETAPTSTKAIDHAATLFQKAIIPALVGRRILLADTNALHRHVLREELLWQGVERVDEAKDGQHALQLMRELNYDVVVLDLVLPVLNGLECLKELEIAKAAGSHVPIVFGMSNAAEREDIALAFEYGMRAFFNKPADVEDICAMICRLLEKTPPQTANGLASPEGETRSISQPGLASPAHDPESPPPRSAMRRLVRLGQRLRRLFGNLPLRLQRGTSRGTSIEEHPSKPEKSESLTLCTAH
jgi:CheY-like chemotaxis protein